MEVEVGGATGTEGMAGEEVELGRGEAEMEEVFGEEVGEGVDRHGAGAEDVGLQLAAREGEEEEVSGKKRQGEAGGVSLEEAVCGERAGVIEAYLLGRSLAFVIFGVVEVEDNLGGEEVDIAEAEVEKLRDAEEAIMGSGPHGGVDDMATTGRVEGPDHGLEDAGGNGVGAFDGFG